MSYKLELHDSREKSPIYWKNFLDHLSESYSSPYFPAHCDWAQFRATALDCFSAKFYFPIANNNPDPQSRTAVIFESEADYLLFVLRWS